MLHHLGQVVEKLDDRVSGWLGVFRGQGQQPGEPAHPLHQRRRARGAVLPDDQVTLPVPRHPTLGGVLTSLRDRDHTYDWATARPPGRTWSALGPLGLQEDALAGELTLRDCVDVLVDSLTGDGSAACVRRVRHAFNGRVCRLQTQPARYLVRRPGRGQVGVHPRLQHRIPRDLPLLRASSPTLRSDVCGHGLVAAGLRRVPVKLPRDHRRATPQVTGDPPHRPARFRGRRDLRPVAERQPHPRHLHTPPIRPPPTGSVASTL